MFDYEWATLQHRVNCRLANRVLVPDAIPLERLARYGARPPKLVRYPGLKEEYYLADFEPDDRVLDELGVDPERILCVVRTAPSYALYLGGAESALLPRVLRHLRRTSEPRRSCSPATTSSVAQSTRLGLPRVVVPHRAVDGRSLVAFADLLVSAGGTMNREAAVLGLRSGRSSKAGSAPWTSCSRGKDESGSWPTRHESSCGRSRQAAGRLAFAAIPPSFSAWRSSRASRRVGAMVKIEHEVTIARTPCRRVRLRSTDVEKLPEWQATALEGRLESDRMEQGARGRRGPPGPRSARWSRRSRSPSTSPTGGSTRRSSPAPSTFRFSHELMPGERRDAPALRARGRARGGLLEDQDIERQVRRQVKDDFRTLKIVLETAPPE